MACPWPIDSAECRVDSDGMSAFDGAGKPYKGASYKALLVVLVACLVAVGLIWLAYSAALNVDPAVPVPSSVIEP